MRDYRHHLMGQDHRPGKLSDDRSEPVRPQLWRRDDGRLCEIVAVADWYSSPERVVVYREYEPNGRVWAELLESFLWENDDGTYRFTREY